MKKKLRIEITDKPEMPKGFVEIISFSMNKEGEFRSVHDKKLPKEFIMDALKQWIESEEGEKMKTDREGLMLQQLLGFRLGRQGISITELINSAGLTKKEWFNLKEELEDISLSEKDIKEIETYVNNLGREK